MKVLTKDGKPILVEGKMLCVDEVTQISDITVNGDSIVVDGVAEIPLASDVQPGIVKTNLSAGVQISNDALLGMTKTSQQYSQGSNGLFISKGTLENIKSDIVQRAFDETSVESEGSVIENSYLENAVETTYPGWSISKYYKIKPNTFYLLNSPNGSISATYSALYDENKNPVGKIGYYSPKVFFSKAKGYIRVSATTTAINSLDVSILPFINIFDKVMLKTGYATQANIDARSSTEAYISPSNLVYAVTSVGDSIYEPKKGDWVLKGTLTTDNKDTGVNVDLTGCSELMIKSYINATGDINSTLVGASLGNCVYGMGRNGNAYYVGIWKDVEGLGVLNTTSVFGIYGFGQLTPSTGVLAYTYCNPYAKISNATALTLNNQSNITECNIEIWAR